MAIETTVTGRWQSFLPATAEGQPTYRWQDDYAEPATVEGLRASIGEHRATVWLPSGKRVVARLGADRSRFQVGWRSPESQGGNKRRILFTVES